MHTERADCSSWQCSRVLCSLSFSCWVCFSDRSSANSGTCRPIQRRTEGESRQRLWQGFTAMRRQHPPTRNHQSVISKWNIRGAHFAGYFVEIAKPELELAAYM